MMFSLVEIIILLVAVIGSGTMAALIMHVHARLQRLESGFDPADKPAALVAKIDALRIDVESLQNTVERLTERTDFTERLLEEKTGEET